MTNIDAAMKAFVAERYKGEDDFQLSYDIFLKMGAFSINENAFENDLNLNDSVLNIIRLSTQYHLTEAFKCMKIDLTDPNVAEKLSEGNIGTPGRLAKLLTTSNISDMTESLAGRWTTKPRMASFPNHTGEHHPVFVKTKLDAMCSHHLIRFGDDSSDKDSFVIIGYIPDEKLGGISKINRFVDWCSRRGWLQEDLAQYISSEVASAFETRSVYVALVNLKHGCASTRGACDREAATTTIVSTGQFKTNPDLIPPKFRA